MKDDALLERLREASWRRKLSPDEQAQLKAWLETHPDAQKGWELELSLNQALDKLPNIVVPSNFTARVTEAALLETRTAPRQRTGGFIARLTGLAWMPKLAVASVVLGAGLFAYHEIHQARLGEIRSSLITISEVPSLANPEILEDFDAIQVMSQTPKADEDLLRLLQ